MRKFNTEGPVVAADHYLVPPLQRVNLGEVLDLIRDKRYFVLHAPRQTGKTSLLLALRDLLNSGAEGRFRCVYVNVEGAQAAREDVARAIRAVMSRLASRARRLGDDFPDQVWADLLAKCGPDDALAELLTQWSAADARPLVLLIDEIDVLIGDALLAVLRQLRAGYDERPSGFPQSIALCGVRDVRAIAGGSPFNVKAASLRLGGFTETEVRALLAQHTAETGQPFTPEALAAVWNQTCGQPWLVNALCRRACFDAEGGRDRARGITRDAILAAQEHLIVSRQTHLDQLADKLQEARVRRVVEPLLSGAAESAFTARDLEYVRDLGLVAPEEAPRIANPIYAEVVPRELTSAAQAAMVQQRIVNGGVRIEREYGLGRGRTDLLIIWPRGGGAPPSAADRFVVECKVLRGSLQRTVAEGLEQTSGYLDRCAAQAGHLVIFDRTAGKRWADKLFRRAQRSADGRAITIWGM